ncbi:MAG TPA: hypothetical protein VIT45_12760 [Allosphingosinicella sp.]
MFVLLAAPSPATLNQARQTYSGCLSTLLKTNLKERVAPDVFETSLSTACKTEESTFRNASVGLDVANGTSRTSAEQSANFDITDIVENTKQRYKDYVETNTEPR